MSKKRNRHQSLSGILNRTTSSFSTEPKPIFGATMTKSYFIPQKSTANSSLNMTDYNRDRVFSKYCFDLLKETYHFLGSRQTRTTQGCCTSCHLWGRTRQSTMSIFFHNNEVFPRQHRSGHSAYHRSARWTRNTQRGYSMLMLSKPVFLQHITAGTTGVGRTR